MGTNRIILSAIAEELPYLRLIDGGDECFLMLKDVGSYYRHGIFIKGEYLVIELHNNTKKVINLNTCGDLIEEVGDFIDKNMGTLMSHSHTTFHKQHRMGSQ